jgi:hypothetical protein
VESEAKLVLKRLPHLVRNFFRIARDRGVRQAAVAAGRFGAVRVGVALAEEVTAQRYALQQLTSHVAAMAAGLHSQAAELGRLRLAVESLQAKQQALGEGIRWCRAGLLPSAFRDVVALITCYNEADVIAHCVRKLVSQGIGVYLLDNWSTDGTLQEALRFAGPGLIGYEKFPPEGPSAYHELERELKRKEELHDTLGARWYIHQDADEVREAPWPGVSLAEGIRRVDREGYNCIDHLVLEFKPTDDDFVSGSDMESRFRYFETDPNPGNTLQEKCWKYIGQRIDLAGYAGHSIQFPGKRIYPIPFLLKHYPIRSQTHGVRKVLGERRPRFAPHLRAKGWHIHYDAISQGTCFLADAARLEVYEELAIKTRHLRQSRAA